jgi:hypothetical protein
MTCKITGCRAPAQDPYSRCSKHQRAYLKRGAAPKPQKPIKAPALRRETNEEFLAARLPTMLRDYKNYANYDGWYDDHYFVRAACTSLCGKKTFKSGSVAAVTLPAEYCATCKARQATSSPPPSAQRWQQFEQHVLMDLRAARVSLARVSGMALSDGMIKWSGEARELAARVQVLASEIEENAQRVLQEACR